MDRRSVARARALYAAKQNTVHEIMQMTGFHSRRSGGGFSTSPDALSGHRGEMKIAIFRLNASTVNLRQPTVSVCPFHT